jgi:hypothetical protein
MPEEALDHLVPGGLQELPHEEEAVRVVFDVEDRSHGGVGDDARGATGQGAGVNVARAGGDEAGESAHARGRLLR